MRTFHIRRHVPHWELVGEGLHVRQVKRANGRVDEGRVSKAACTQDRLAFLLSLNPSPSPAPVQASDAKLHCCVDMQSYGKMEVVDGADQSCRNSVLA